MSDTKKLPKWAQTRIEDLERKVVELTKALEHANEQQDGPHRVEVRGAVKRFGNSDRLTFQVNGGVLRAYVVSERGREHLVVSGDHQLIILPTSTNWVNILP